MLPKSPPLPGRGDGALFVPMTNACRMPIILPRETGEGDHAKASLRGLRKVAWPHGGGGTLAVHEIAPCTALRAVPLSRRAGEDENGPAA